MNRGFVVGCGKEKGKKRDTDGIVDTKAETETMDDVDIKGNLRRVHERSFVVL